MSGVSEEFVATKCVVVVRGVGDWEDSKIQMKKDGHFYVKCVYTNDEEWNVVLRHC